MTGLADSAAYQARLAALRTSCSDSSSSAGPEADATAAATGTDFTVNRWLVG